MSYNSFYENSKALPAETLSRKLKEFATTTGEDLIATRFSRSLPSVPSGPSAATTEYDESEPPSPGEQLQDQEDKELRNSTANGQFAIQTADELNRLRTAHDKGLLQQPHITEWREAAKANVRYRWIQQGIWDKSWDNKLHKKWKHECEDSSQSLQPSRAAHVIEPRAKEPTSKRKTDDIASDYEKAEQSAIEMQTRQLSRPCYQFIHQFCEERQWIKMGLSIHIPDPSADIDATAYEIVKSRWIRDGIWDDGWNLIPGVWWKHERPRKHPPTQELFRRAETRTAAKIQEAERPPEWYPMAPEKPLIIDKNRSLSPMDSYFDASDSPGPETAVLANTKPSSESRKQNGFLSGSPVENLTTKDELVKNRKSPPPPQKRKVRSEASIDEQNLAKNKGKDHTLRHAPKKQRRDSGVVLTRPRRAAAVAAMNKMANMTC